MSHPTLFWNGVTRAQYTALQAAAAKQGIVIPGDSGPTIQAHGCRVDYRYDPAVQSLTLTLISAPMFFGGVAISTLHNLVEGALNQPSPTAPAAPAEGTAK